MRKGCYRPITLKSGEQVPCSRCPKCRARRISGWSFRLQQQLKVSDSAYFITLTYADNNLPVSPRGLCTLSKIDLQRYFKRLRKSHGARSRKLKYYAVGEYGGRTHRPHYHVLLFNAQLELIAKAWTLDGKFIGLVHHGDERGVNASSVGYTLKYMEKPTKVNKYNYDDRQREFALMSKGLGKSYLSKSNIRWHKADVSNRMYVNIGDGKKAAMPRYLKEKIFNEQEREIVKETMLAKMIYEQLRQLASETPASQARRLWNEKQAAEYAYRKMYSSQNQKTKV